MVNKVIVIKSKPITKYNQNYENPTITIVHASAYTIL